MNQQIPAGDLRLGDVVKLSPDNGEPFNEMVVVKKTLKEIRFSRVYITLANFEYTGGVIRYIGTEDYILPLPHPANYIRISNIYKEL